MNTGESNLRTRWLYALVLLLMAGQAAMTLVLPGQTDEVSYVNPGASLALGDGFSSNLWFAQMPDEAWAGSTPGMPLLYAGWFSLVGFGALQSKLLSLALHFLGIFLLARWARSRHGLSSDDALVFQAALLALPSLVLAGVSCRLEVFALLAFTWFLAIYFPPPGKATPWWSPVLAGVVITVIGAHLVGYYALAATLIFLAAPSRGRFFRGLGYASGIILGIALLYAFFRANGTWESFVSSRVRYMQSQNTDSLEFLLHGWRLYAPLPDVVLFGGLSLVLLAASFVSRRSWLVGLRWPATWALGVYLAVPTWVNAIGIYYTNYSWMVTLPAICIFLPALIALARSLPTRALAALALLLVISYALVAGYMVRKGIRLSSQFGKAAQVLRANATPDQAIVLSQYAYYDVRPYFSRLHLRSTPKGLEQRRAGPICWIIEQRSAALAIARDEGGQWSEELAVPGGGTGLEDVVVLRKR